MAMSASKKWVSLCLFLLLALLLLGVHTIVRPDLASASTEEITAHPIMDSSLLEKLITGRKNAVRELTEARELANQLRAIINEPFGTDRSVEADHLISKIWRSFTDTISMLNTEEVSDLITARPAAMVMNPASREFGVAGKRTLSPSPLNPLEVRKRRKIVFKRTVTSNLSDDGHSWRKYGEKGILGAKHPRAYFKCMSRGCEARKQAQKTDDDPAMYEIQYRGEHTCKNISGGPPQIILDSTTSMESTDCKNHFKAYPRIILDSSTPVGFTGSPDFSFVSSNSPDPYDKWDYQSCSASTTVDHPPVIISSYRT